jgi:hypothetical protein
LSEVRPLVTVDGAIWVLFLTAVAYGVAFQYEEGYARQLGLPFSLMDVSLVSLYRSLMWVGLIAGLVFVLESLVVMMLLESMLKIKASVFNRSFTAGAILYALLAALFHVRSAWVLSGGFCLVLAAYLIAPLRVKKRHSYAEKIAMAEARVAAGVSPPHLSPRFALVFVGLLITGTAFLVAAEAGRSEARDQKQFLVADTSPPCVIVNAHGDALICAEFSGNRLLGQFHLLSKEDRDLKLTLKKVGPLQPVSEQ